VAPVPADWHERTLVIHGEQDDTVPLSSVMDWARPQALPVTVIPGVAHFFHGQLPLLRSLVVRHLQA
jgi:alpha/beta superfamily hydrolase